MMKIAYISPYDFPYPGGVTEHIVGLANSIRGQGHQVQILAASSGYKGQTVPHTRVVARQITAVPIGGALARVSLSPWGYGAVRRILQQEKFDVIHLHEPFVPGTPWFVLMQARALPRTALIGTFHAYHDHPHWMYRHSRPIFKTFFTRLDRLIAVSAAARDFAGRMFPGNYQIIPNGINLARFACPPADAVLSAGSRLTILFVGRLDKRKGFSTLFQAFLNLKPRYPHLHLKVVGPFEPEAAQPYLAVARARGVTGIEFAGYVPAAQLPAVYHQADIFCAPSLGFESFGIVLLEAMAAGLPVVASNIAGYRSVITAGREGILAPPGRPSALARALGWLVDNPRSRTLMGRRGQEKARRYSWERIAAETLQVYEDALRRKLHPKPTCFQFPNVGVCRPPGPVNPEGKTC